MTRLLLVALITLLATPALARTGKMDGRGARPHVKSYYKAKGWSSKIRVHKVRTSRSGKSAQIAVTTRGTNKVRLFNVTHRTGKVAATRTGLVKQSKARSIANLRLRRENKPNKGTFSGVNSSGLSRSGKTYKFTSNTDRGKKAERAYVNIRTGGLRRYDR